ncbi:MAG TPA: IPT/TIG domain-containing protein [Vicinamibacteria bacterium]|nr:IPT/TIG domain-containing protein [Vicinamibacteria bacterium]
MAPQRTPSTSGFAAAEVALVLATLLLFALAVYLASEFWATPQVAGVFPTPARETVTLRGAHFSSEPGGNIVLFGDKVGRVLRASPTALDVEVPDFGLSGAGQLSVPVRVLVGDRSSTGRAVTVAAPLEKAAPPSPPPTVVATALTPAATPSPEAPLPSPPAPEEKTARALPSPSPPGPDLNAMLDEADSTAKGRKFEAAVQIYDEVLKKEPENARARTGRTTAQSAVASLQKTFASGKTAGEGRGARSDMKAFDVREVSVKKPAEVPGRLEFEVIPPRLAAGDAYRVKVFLQNEGSKGIKVATLRVSSALNGARSDAAVPPPKVELAPRERALLYEEAGVWRDGVTSWSLDVQVGSGRGDTYRNQILWK